MRHRCGLNQHRSLAVAVAADQATGPVWTRGLVFTKRALICPYPAYPAYLPLTRRGTTSYVTSTKDSRYKINVFDGITRCACLGYNNNRSLIWEAVRIEAGYRSLNRGQLFDSP